ncbi:hypothetical protein [Streptomyces sp. NPDC004728]|uniref:hypothetical protein n=1 Tax=Streptomyces sp. NPDC004728 TaxID=3154289 RepID=UPI0033AC7A22
MASIVERPKKDGTTTYQVKWRQDGEWQSEKFGDPEGAGQFKNLVEAHGGQWPHGWVRGKGFAEETAIPGDMPFEAWAARYIDRLTGVEGRAREGYRRDLRRILTTVRTRKLHTVHAMANGICRALLRRRHRVHQPPNLLALLSRKPVRTFKEGARIPGHRPLRVSTKELGTRRVLHSIERGDRGPVGPTGPVATPSPGPAGAAGSDGATGPQGDTGPAGPAGPAGRDGRDGADGRNGQTRPDGYSLQPPPDDPDALVCRRNAPTSPDSAPSPAIYGLPAERRRS